MTALLLRLVALLCAHTSIAAYAAAHPAFADHVPAAARYHGVPEVLLLAVGLHESGLGSDPRTPYAWGVLPPTLRAYCARADARCTGDALHDQIEASGFVLRAGVGVCGTWEGAARWYLTGACMARAPQAPRGAGSRRAFRRRLRLYREAVAYGARVVGSARRLEAHARAVAGPDVDALLPLRVIR